ncbi:class I SAM-dependent methyltransferase [Streptomyces rimosus]|uniref:class I SAM-dependent methyltransferase n=1 Tax=Streptomyces rimosus TaxID=1927 RepID=UPI0037D6C1B3
MGYTTRDQWHQHYADGRSFRPLIEPERRFLADRLPARPGARALDVGCGTGELACYLHALGYSVLGIDYAPSAIDASRQAAAGLGAGIIFRLLDIEAPGPYFRPDPGFDLVTCRLSYAFLRDRDAFHHRVRRLLRPGGALCVMTQLVQHVPPHRRDIALDGREVKALTEAWGEVEESDTDRMTPLLLRHPRPAHAREASRVQPEEGTA